MSDLFDQLADQPPPPPPPASLDRRVHERLNYVLAALHCAEFFFRAVPHAMLWFLRGVAGWVHVALTGSQVVEPRREEKLGEETFRD